MIDPRIKIRHLKTFVEVSRQKSVAKAADVLHVSQPAITKTMRELEAVLKVALLERDGRGIRVSRQGEMFLRHAAVALGALKLGIDAVSQQNASDAPLLRIGALPTVSSRIMPLAMTLFLRETPWCRIRIVTGENAVLLDQLRTGDLDLVIGRLAAAEKMTGFSFEHLYSEQVVFAVRAGHPLLDAGKSLFGRLQDHAVLVPTAASIIRPVVDGLLIANGIACLKNPIETVSDAFGRAFLRSSDAVWIISHGVVSEDVSSGLLALLPIDTSMTKGPVGLTARTDCAPSPSLYLFIDVLRKAVAERELHI